jgi:hypothetical protein
LKSQGTPIDVIPKRTFRRDYDDVTAQPGPVWRVLYFSKARCCCLTKLHQWHARPGGETGETRPGGKQDRVATADRTGIMYFASSLWFTYHSLFSKGYLSRCITSPVENMLTEQEDQIKPDKDHNANSICWYHSRLGAIPPEPYSQLQIGRMATGNAVVASTLHAKSSTALSTMLGMAPGQ